MASICSSIAGPGSITVTSSVPTKYVFVPGPVKTLPFPAVILLIRGEI